MGTVIDLRSEEGDGEPQTTDASLESWGEEDIGRSVEYIGPKTRIPAKKFYLIPGARGHVTKLVADEVHIKWLGFNFTMRTGSIHEHVRKLPPSSKDRIPGRCVCGNVEAAGGKYCKCGKEFTFETLIVTLCAQMQPHGGVSLSGSNMAGDELFVIDLPKLEQKTMCELRPLLPAHLNGEHLKLLLPNGQLLDTVSDALSVAKVFGIEVEEIDALGGEAGEVEECYSPKQLCN